MRNSTKYNEFKAEIARRGMTLKDFCKLHDFHYVMFNQAINGLANMREEYDMAISTFLNEPKQTHLFTEVIKDGSSQESDS